MNDNFDDVSAEKLYEPDDFEQYNQNEADDYRNEYNSSAGSSPLPSNIINW